MEDICISLGTAARFLVRRGFAKEQSVAQLLKVLERARSFGLTHITDNIRHQPSFICNCCSCCCELLAGVQMGFHSGIAKAPFLIAVDSEHCNGCGLCSRTCNVAALVSTGAQQPVQLRQEICLGCGACVAACRSGALSLVARPEKYTPPENRKEMMKQRLIERGRTTPYVISGIKKKLTRLVKRKPEKESKIP